GKHDSSSDYIVGPDHLVLEPTSTLPTHGTFPTDSAPIVSVLGSLQCYPNPSSHGMTALMLVTPGTPVILRLADPIGRIVYEANTIPTSSTFAWSIPRMTLPN